MSDRIAKLLTRLRKGIAKSQEIFESLEPDQWDMVLYEKPYPWSARDLLAHFVSAEAGLLRLARDVAAGGPGAPREFEYDAFNATEQERLAHVPREQLLADLMTARQVTITWVEELEETALDRTGRHPALGEVTVEVCINAIYGHQLMHMRDLMQVLD
ncbi:MAG: DinB family protein [Anaerolineae bacterium]|jgi:hypothetical protein